MKTKKIKNLLSIMLAFVILFYASGCSNKSWCVKDENETLPVGVYICYMYSAYQTAQSKVEDTNKSVLKQTVEDKNGEDYIKDTALTNCKNILAVNSKLNELNISLTDEEIEEAKNSVSSTWSQMSKILEGYGISKDSFDIAIGITPVKYEKLFEALYSEGGTQEVTEEDFKNYFQNEYISYSYISKSLTDIDDEQKVSLEENFNNYAAKINDGSSNIIDISEEYKTSENLESSPLVSNVAKSDEIYLPDDVKDVLINLQTNNAQFVKTDSQYYLIYKDDISNSLSKLEDQNFKQQLLVTMKNDEFTSMLDETANSLNISINKSALRKYKPSMFVK